MTVMTVTSIRSPPALDEFTPLSEHQQQTPESFYGGKAILHHHVAGAKAWIPACQSTLLPLFPAHHVAHPTGPEGAALNGTVGESVEQRVDVYVNTENLTIFCPAAEVGVQIPYHVISLHALKKVGSHQEFESVFMQLELSDGGGDDDDFDTVELTLVPCVSSVEEAPVEEAPVEEATKLFEAISTCSALHVDEVDDEHGDTDRIVFERDVEPIEGLSGVYQGAASGHLPPALSSSGWITAENVDQFFDKDGNWMGGGTGEGADEDASGALGSGAGTVHGRDGDDAVHGSGSSEDIESKRARTG